VTSFRNGFLSSLALPPAIVSLLGKIAETKGRQDSFAQRHPQGLAALTQTALLQSVEASNRIAGVTIAAERLRPLVLGQAKPRTLAEKKLRGYRQALRLIFREARRLEPTVELAARFHGLCEQAQDSAEAAAGVAELFSNYRRTLACGEIHPLVTTAALALDFFVAHPFRDGNGRISRLLIAFGLAKHGYLVGEYISLDRLIEETRDQYFARLHESGERWVSGKHNLLPFLTYFLELLGRAYVLLEDRSQSMLLAKGEKTVIIEAAIDAFPETFTLEELARACPGVSMEMIRKVLRAKHKRNEVRALGKGPGASWTKTFYAV